LRLGASFVAVISLTTRRETKPDEEERKIRTSTNAPDFVTISVAKHRM